MKKRESSFRKGQKQLAAVFFFVFATALCFHAQSYDGQPAPLVSTEKPKEMEGIGIDEKIGTTLDLTTPFADENGQQVTLASYFDGKTPVVLSLVYYSCPGLCNFHLNGLVDGLKGVDWNMGEKYKMVEISFDPKETPAMASAKKANYVKVYDRTGSEKSWHFLTGTPESIKKITEAVGFKYKWIESEKEWSHASAAVVITPQGMISRYLPGIFFEPQDLKLALNEATAGKTGNFIDSLVLYCFQYNPHLSKYTLVASNVMKLGGVVIILFLGLWLGRFWRRSLVNRKREELV
jgi:protein SCO1